MGDADGRRNAVMERWLEALASDEILAVGEVDRARRQLRQAPLPTAHPLEQLAALSLRRTPDGTLEREALLRWLSHHSGLCIETVTLAAVDVAGAVPRPFAERHSILLLRMGAEQAVVACSDPFVRDWEAPLAAMLGREICRVLADPSELRQRVGQFARLHQSVRAADQAHALPSVTQLASPLADSESQPSSAVADWLLQYAMEQRASDLHLEPRGATTQVRLRIDGSLHTLYQLPDAVALAVIARFKVLASMDVTERRRPQDGRLHNTLPGGDTLELRLATLPTAHGEKLVVRLLDSSVVSGGLEALGMMGAVLAAWRRLALRRHGLILVTGPTGSGKSATLYATLRTLADGEHNICTVEDPIEIIDEAFNQTQVRPDLGLDFASGIRALLRQDPDVIMIGEIRDPETARMAVQAALTGHLVLATLHTNNSFDAVARLLDLEVPDYLLRATLVGVMAQRLARALCRHCRRPAPAAEPELWHQLSPSPLPHFHLAEGCLQCRHSGHRGRLALFELLEVSPAVCAALGRNGDQLRTAVERAQHSTLRAAAAARAAAGEISLHEALRVATDGAG